MFLREMFEEGSKDPSLHVEDGLEKDILDMLTPLLAQKVPFVTVDQVIDDLRRDRPGIYIDRELVMDLLNPAKIHAIERIDGDKVILTGSAALEPQQDEAESQQQSEIERIKDTARKQAKVNMKKPA